MFVIGLSKLINRNLIHFFDQSRIRYMIFVFPTYQILAFIGIAAGLCCTNRVMDSLPLTLEGFSLRAQ